VGVFADYVNSYSDLNSGWDTVVANGPKYGLYVDDNSDLAEAYNKATKNPAWGQYVDRNSDLKAAWDSLSSADKQKWGTKGAWGQNHYSNYGQSEGRVVPFFYGSTSPGSLAVTNKEEWGAAHYSSNGKKEGRLVPYDAGDSDSVYSKDEYGERHWGKYGVNEDRIVPGTVKLTYTNGKLAVPSDALIGAKARSTYDSIANQLNSSSGGNYKALIEGISKNLGQARFDDLLSTGGKKIIDTYYKGTKITPWDAAKFGAQPPAGGFDDTYYSTTTTGKEALQKWKDASSGVSAGGYSFADLDITERYDQTSFLHKYYTDVGKSSGDRGNKAIDANLPQEYSEKLTDADYQLYRDQVLGLASDEYPSTILEGKLGTVLDAKDKQKQQMFGALTQDSLKESINELKKAKKQESTLSLFRGLPGYDEIYNLNNTLSNSLLGDSGVGGLLSITKNTDDLQKSLEKQLSGVTGINTSNSAVYNWQQWFDTVLTKRYEEGLTISDPADAQAQYEIDKEFASKFISDYLKPRFDTSRSMDEFVSYMDVTQKEENIFQTQSALDSLRTLADVRAKAYLDGVQGKAALNFDPDFYFNPAENEERADAYTKQASDVAADWEAAKKGDAFWATEAYRYGLDVKDKAQFAKLHYEVKGAKEGYDAARDVITLKDAQEYIDKTILPAVAEKEIALGDTAFLQFVTPEEFADKLIEGISPEANKEEWKKLLDQFGLDDKGQSVTELRDYIIEALRTGAAKDIRESIKYLNEKKVAPSQEELGITYIQREEDKKPTASPSETQLYKIFKGAGYQGTEDEFYENFFPDADRSEQVALTKAGTGAGFQTGGIDMSDPFAALSSLGSFFDSSNTTTTGTSSKTSTKTTTKSPSYFSLFSDSSTDESSQKTKSGQQILGEFTSLFKGFT